MNQWQIGDVKITRVVEIESLGGSRFILPDATRDACLPYGWMQPHFMDEQGNLLMSVHALVVDTGEHRILVDTCIGNDKERNVPNWSHLQTHFLQDLETAGYAPDTIDTVLCTHLHVDHVGWNTMLVAVNGCRRFPTHDTYLPEPNGNTGTHMMMKQSTDLYLRIQFVPWWRPDSWTWWIWIIESAPRFVWNPHRVIRPGMSACIFDPAKQKL